ncbi:phage terminase family protein [Nocardioides aquaticus]|uniref:phage terminase family protein n=1 Tax=Nocardioides aquaticus TaxID=160826 RepID=UPI001BD686B8|nr:phage terminase family protein [Nocardioides aquaticus]
MDGTEPWVVGHRVSRVMRPDLIDDPGNWQAEHRGCSDASAQAAVIEKARAEGARAALSDFPHDDGPGQPPLLPTHTREASVPLVEARDGLAWADLCRDAPQWLTPYLDVPGDGAPPLWVTGVHPDAVGSMGPAAIEWMESNVMERGRPLRLRWWQKLAIVLQLQHRADGTLCWRVILESGPRRIGKSVRLRGMALWRLANGPTLFEPEQLVLHTGKDLAIVREVMRKAWAWAQPLEDWDIKRGMTEPEVSYLGVNRWVARSKDSTTGYDACLALCDEAWDVPPSSIDDDLEPTMLERQSPQLVLTSTAHRRATSLMRGRILDALATDDGETLLLVWAMPPGADPGDETAWRSASPHWSEDRRRMVGSKYAKALAGEADPEADDPDPMQGFIAQYGNVWRFRERRQQRGEGITTETRWGALVETAGVNTPDGAAIESWFGRGISLSLVWRLDERLVVSVSDHADFDSAVDALRATGYRGRTPLGASLMTEPAARRVNRTKGESRTATSVNDLSRMLSEDLVRHDGGQHLTDQVLAVRTLPGADGPRMVSSSRADAIKAAVWAIRVARARIGKPRVVVASS